MTDTLFNAVLETTRLVGDLRLGVASSGSTTTIVDITRPESTDYFKNGIAFITTNATGSAAPENEFARITASSTSTITVGGSPTFSVDVAASDVYAVSVGRFSLDQVISAVNAAVSGIKIPALNSTALTTVDNQTEYLLPAGITGNNLRQVHYQLITDDSNDNRWVELRDWRVLSYAGTTQDILVLPQLSSSHALRLDYVTTASVLTSSSQTIDKYIHLDRIKYRAAEHLFANEIAWSDNYDGAQNMANYFANKAVEAEQKHPIHLPPKNGRVIAYTSLDSDYTGEVGKVRL